MHLEHTPPKGNILIIVVRRRWPRGYWQLRRVVKTLAGCGSVGVGFGAVGVRFAQSQPSQEHAGVIVGVGALFGINELLVVLWYRVISITLLYNAWVTQCYRLLRAWEHLVA